MASVDTAVVNFGPRKFSVELREIPKATIGPEEVLLDIVEGLAEGKALDLKAVQAPSRAAAAAYYPGIYWYSMLNIPPANLFPGTGPGAQEFSRTPPGRTGGYFATKKLCPGAATGFWVWRDDG